jgi:hypothetical protein
MTFPFPHNDDSFEFEKDLEIDVSIDLNMYLDVVQEVYVETEIYVDVCVDPYIEGNTAQLALDVEALGDDTFVDTQVSVLTTDDMSSVAVWAFSAVD